MSTPRLDNPVQYVKGVGPHRAKALASLGIHTVADLLAYYPFRLEYELGEVAIEDMKPGDLATVRGEVVSIHGRPPHLECELDDGTGACLLAWFNQPCGRLRLFRGATVIATGRVQIYDGLPQIVQPTIQVYEPNAVLLERAAGARLVGVYRGSADVKSSVIRRAVQGVLLQPRLGIDDPLPRALLNKRRLLPREQAVRAMHAPASQAEHDKARTRLAYEEFLLMELAMALRRRRRLALQQGQRLHVTPQIDERIRARFPFTLTASQDQVVREIAADLQSGRPMTRLLQGDVGSGKTVVALYAALVAIANGKQAAIMAPTEILAQQHYANIERYLSGSRVRSVLLRGRIGRKQREQVLADIEAGQIDLVVGTQALIQKDVAFNALALVVVDEQHKFGVLQRHTFRTKGPMPHYLVMTATPIPRTLAMTVFGDLDVSIIRHTPPGRGRIITKVVTSRQWPTVMAYVRKRLEAGEQAYVVCPLIGEGDHATADDDQKDAAAVEAGGGTTRPERRHSGTPPRGKGGTFDRNADLLAATDVHRNLAGGPWLGLDVGLLHGSLRSAQKQQTIGAFVDGRMHAVVSTTVVEVGVDVPNATIMIVENAERFGLSQLHQLRGRVGRGAKDSLCVLIARGHGPKARERIAVMTQTTDGFKIAEADLRQRGPGELFGTRQHGLPELHIASVVDDFALLEQAREDAFAIVHDDPELCHPDHQGLLPALKKVFGEKLKLIDAA